MACAATDGANGVCVDQVAGILMRAAKDVSGADPIEALAVRQTRKAVSLVQAQHRGLSE